VEIEDWNEYGELKEHVTIYYDDHTIPPISQAPKEVPKPAPALVMKPAAAPTAPPLPTEEKPKAEFKSAAGSSSVSAKTIAPIKSIADEAAAKAKQLHLQSLRDKVHGKGGAKRDEEKNKAVEAPASKAPGKDGKGDETLEAKMSSVSISSDSKLSGLQSPTSSAWKQSASFDALRETLQSPTTTSWKPTDTDQPVKTFMGSKIASATEEEIEAIEKSQTIKEEPEEENEEGDSEEGDDDESEDSNDEDEGGEAEAVPKKKN
jgi:hypothetical protein